jgi:hypothetical protein
VLGWTSTLDVSSNDMKKKETVRIERLMVSLGMIFIMPDAKTHNGVLDMETGLLDPSPAASAA